MRIQTGSPSDATAPAAGNPAEPLGDVIAINERHSAGLMR
jgi:hypothetical protein